ncbi:MAG: helix-turn-helix domain-containing protein [Microscillaceae bacterium]|jgi:DNA-binding XRE family transcriptional regulator|nr:helix-turn-helix domain-containing protein [Microscillaceae bacterium]
MEKNPTIQLILDEVCRLRLAGDISQVEMAEHLEISQAAYNKIENGRTKLKHQVLIEIAIKFNVPIEHFYQLIHNSQSSKPSANA